YTLSGIITGIALLWSNDFAIPAAGLFALFILCNAYFRDEFKCKNFLLYFCGTWLSWAILLSLITQGYAVALLKYNFLDIAQNQWWFFPSYNESSRIFGFQDIARFFCKETLFPLSVLMMITICAIKTRRIEHALVAWIGLVLFAGGIVPSIGGHFDGYFR